MMARHGFVGECDGDGVGNGAVNGLVLRLSGRLFLVSSRSIQIYIGHDHMN